MYEIHIFLGKIYNFFKGGAPTNRLPTQMQMKINTHLKQGFVSMIVLSYDLINRMTVYKHII